MADETIEGWFIVELMGRKKLAGRVREVAIAGSGFLRVDVPEAGAESACTVFIRPETVYCLTPTTEEIARATATHYRPEPVSRWELDREAPRAALGSPTREPEGLDDDDF